MPSWSQDSYDYCRMHVVLLLASFSVKQGTIWSGNRTHERRVWTACFHHLSYSDRLLLVPFLEMQRSGIENSNGFGYEAWRQKSYSTASRYILQDAAGYHHKGTFTLYRPAWSCMLHKWANVDSVDCCWRLSQSAFMFQLRRKAHRK